MAERYSIQQTAQISGLTAHVIRAWENRYQAVSPLRSEGNQRLYSEDDVQRLYLLSQAVHAGHRISTVVGMSHQELEKLALRRDQSSSGEHGEDDVVERCLQSVRDLKADELEERIAGAAIEMGMIACIDNVIVPLMRRIGEEWHRGNIRAYHEHLASSVIRTYLGNRIRGLKSPETAPVAVVTTPSGQIHEFGSLVVAIAAASAGFEIVFLGSDLPAEEIIQSIHETGASVLLLSIVFPGSTARVRKELEVLRRYLPETCRLILGGASAEPFLEEGETPSPRNMLAFRNQLLEVREDILSGVPKTLQKPQ